MRDILISSAVCVACLLVALVSQLVSPTPPAAAQNLTTQLADQAPAIASSPSPVRPTRATAALATPANRFELDPDEPNPTLFAMAPDNTAEIAQAGALGGELNAP
ncbi:MAG: FKBP-type peptidyl-prolyl cis-trans isomerase, partial [Vulcanococcus sp.]